MFTQSDAVVDANRSACRRPAVFSLVLAALFVGKNFACAQTNEFEFHDLTIVVTDSVGVPVPNAEVRAYHAEWYLTYPQSGTGRTGVDGRLELRVPKGSYTVVAGGGASYTSFSSGKALLLKQSVLVDSDVQITLAPDQSSELRFYDRQEQPADADFLEGAPTIMMPNCWMPRIGMTHGGRCLLEFKSEDPLAIFFIRHPAPTDDGYFVLFDDLTLTSAVDLRMSRKGLHPVRFEGYDTNNQPGLIDWILGFPYQDFARHYWHTSFLLTGAADAWFSMDYFDYYPRVRLWDGGRNDYVYFNYQYQGVDLSLNTNVLLQCGGPLSREFRFLPIPWGNNRSQLLLGPVLDSYGNELRFYDPEKRETPRFSHAFEVRDGVSGPVLYQGTLDVTSDNLAFQLPVAFPTSAVFRLEWDLGPLDGLEVIEGRLYDPDFLWQYHTINTRNYSIHAPSWAKAKAEQLAVRWEEAHAAMGALLQSVPKVTSERNFYVHPAGTWASSRGQELYYHGFVWWNPRTPWAWEGTCFHEIGHRMESEAFGWAIDAQPFGEHNEAVAELLSHWTFRQLNGDVLAIPWWSYQAHRFFGYLATPDNPPFPQWHNLFFFFEVYLPQRYGWETHQILFRNWKQCSLGLTGLGYLEKEIVPALFSAICRTNLAWAWRLSGFDVSDSRVEEVRQRAVLVETPPQPVSVAPGETATYTVGVIGGPFFVQWKKDGVPLPGETNLVVHVPNVGLDKTGLYTVEVWNDIIHHETRPVTLSLSGPPVIVEEPTSQSAYEGEYVLFSVSATGTEPLHCQWKRDQDTLPLAINSLLVVRASSAMPPSGYTVAVTNLDGAVTSRVATLDAIPGTSALLARYRLEDSRTDPDILDSVSGQFGQLNVPTRWRTTAGIAGRALAFNGTEDQIRCAGPDLDTNDFSVSIWVKVDRFHQGGIISQGGYCYERGWLLDYGAAGQGTVRFESGLGGTANGYMQTGLNALVPDGQWHHIVASISRGGTSRLSIDGVVRATGSVAGGDLSNTNLVIGGLNNALCGGMVPFAGALDEVQIYGKALNADAVSYLFNHPSAVIWELGPPRLWYSLDGTSLTFTWDQDGYVLQKSADLNNPEDWSDVPGGNTSPAQVGITPGQHFYRLRKQ